MLNDIQSRLSKDPTMFAASAVDIARSGFATKPHSVQSLREARGLDVVTLAGLAGILPDHLRAIEAGVAPTVPERQALAAALNIPVEMIAEG